MNISLILQMVADAEPDRIGLVCDGRRWSYGALWRASQGAALAIDLVPLAQPDQHGAEAGANVRLLVGGEFQA